MVLRSLGIGLLAGFVLGFFAATVLFVGRVVEKEDSFYSSGVVTEAPILSGSRNIQDQVGRKVRSILSDSEVQETLSRIERDRPKHRQDGEIFMNRERKLPLKSDKNYYTEWTVETPGSDDRGARRIIEGVGGEIYFTGDHYQSFTKVR